MAMHNAMQLKLL